MTAPENISNILVIRFARVGDVVLLLPALIHLKRVFAEARLTLLTGSPCAPLAKLCPQVDDVIAVDRLRMRDGSRLEAVRDVIRLVREVRARQFDLVVDFHSFRETNLLSWLSAASYRLGMKRADRAYLPFCFNLDPVLEDKSLHVADMFQRVVERVTGRPSTPRIESPVIAVPPEVEVRSATGFGAGPAVALYVGASVAERRWPATRFAMLASRMSKEWGARVVILSGASEVEEQIARQVEHEARDPRVRLATGLAIPELAGTIAGVDLLVSNDSGPMHMGSALCVPTLGIFSSSLPEHYRPTGVRDRYIKRDSMEEVQTEEVWAIVAEMWATESRSRRS